MATFDQIANLAYSTVLTPPTPAASGTSLVLASGGGALFPTPGTGYFIVVWPTGVGPLLTNAEIVRVTARSSDTLTITRAQQGTGARTILAGDQVALVTTVSFYQAIFDAINAIAPGAGDVVGPASSVDGRPALFDGVTGKLLKEAAAALGSAAFQNTGAFDAAGSAAAAQAAAEAASDPVGSAAAAQAASQPLDAELTAIAALTTTSFGRSFLELANASAARTLAGVVIGTDVQAFAANLAALAALVSAADKLPYFTGSGTASLADFTAAARTLIAASTAALQRAALGSTTVGDAVFIAASAAAARTAIGAVIGTDVQAFNAALGQISALTPSDDDILQRKSSAWTNRTIAQYLADLQGDGSSSTSAGFRGVPPIAMSGDDTVAAEDNGKSFDHTSGTPHTLTIPANGSVALPIGFTFSVDNGAGAGVVTIAITTDTLIFAQDGTTGSRSLAANGVATCRKIASTVWKINGASLT